IVDETDVATLVTTVVAIMVLPVGLLPVPFIVVVCGADAVDAMLPVIGLVADKEVDMTVVGLVCVKEAVVALVVIGFMVVALVDAVLDVAAVAIVLEDTPIELSLVELEGAAVVVLDDVFIVVPVAVVP